MVHTEKSVQDVVLIIVMIGHMCQLIHEYRFATVAQMNCSCFHPVNMYGKFGQDLLNIKRDMEHDYCQSAPINIA